MALKLTREGTSGRATIQWSLKGSGVNAAMVTASDTGSTSGNVTMEAGTNLILDISWFHINMSSNIIIIYCIILNVNHI